MPNEYQVTNNVSVPLKLTYGFGALLLAIVVSCTNVPSEPANGSSQEVSLEIAVTLSLIHI